MVTRTRIKLCGITRRQDAEVAVEVGADALGLVFYPESSRYVAPDVAAELVHGLPPFLTLVGLFVNASQATIQKTLALGFLQVVQLHGDETPAFCRALLRGAKRPLRVIKAWRVATRADVQDAASYGAIEQNGAGGVQAVLLDAKVPHQYGGTGHAFDWSVLSAWPASAPLVLAGGLNPDNVGEAIRRVRPYAVDVSSGVEEAPGRKCARKMRCFVHQVQRADWARCVPPPSPPSPLLSCDPEDLSCDPEDG